MRTSPARTRSGQLRLPGPDASGHLCGVIAQRGAGCVAGLDEERVTDALRSANLTRGPAYFFPFCSFKEMKSPSVIEKFKRGPVGLVTVFPSGPPAMGKNLVQWFIYCLVIGFLAAYLASRTLAPGAAFMQVFRVISIAALLGFGAAHAQESIWSARSWAVTFKHLFDSVIFAAITAGIFAWLWPKAL